jgi:metal-responsive CopG/Arc/MetJ family transcriptional regulator
MKIRRSRKLTKISINLPTLLVENVDYLVEEMDTDRTDVIKEILEAVMENEDLIDMIFGEALVEATENANVDDEEEEEDEEDEEEDESEAEASNEAESEEQT